MFKKGFQLKPVTEDNLNELCNNDEKILCKNKICKFDVYYLGIVQIKEPKNEVLHKEAMKNLLLKKKKAGELHISVNSIIFQDRKTHAFIIDQVLKKIVKCSTFYEVPYSFYYISQDSLTADYQFHGFISCKDVEKRIVNVIEYARVLYSERQVEDIAQSNYFNHDQLHTSFKQVTLSEKIQDLQSAIVTISVPVEKLTNLKSIPRPKVSKSVERKGSFDNFSEGNQEDGLQPRSSPSNSMDYDGVPFISKFEKEVSNIKTSEWYNFSSEEKLQQIHEINQSFHMKKLILEAPKQSINPTNEVLHNVNHRSDHSKYDFLKKLSNQADFGWSEDIIKNDNKINKSTKPFIDPFDDILITDLSNPNQFKTSSFIKK